MDRVSFTGKVGEVLVIVPIEEQSRRKTRYFFASPSTLAPPTTHHWAGRDLLGILGRLIQISRRRDLQGFTR